MSKLAIVAAAWWRATRFAKAAISEPGAHAFHHPGAYALSQGGVKGIIRLVGFTSVHPQIEQENRKVTNDQNQNV
jgi:hypothetical protein